MNTLHINASDNKKTIVGLTGVVHDSLEQETQPRSEQIVLFLIDALLKKHSLALDQIEAIEVDTGPGSFTGIRVGIAVAQALSFSLNIPINGKKAGEFIDPHYT